MGTYLNGKTEVWIISTGYDNDRVVDLRYFKEYGAASWLTSIVRIRISNFMTDTNLRVMVF